MFLRRMFYLASTAIVMIASTAAARAEAPGSSPMKIAENTRLATVTFVCGTSKGSPATIAQTPRGDVPIILWSSEYFSRSGFNPQVRCQTVSNRFQNLYRRGAMEHITAGTVNNLPVLCATDVAGGTCNNDNILFTLEATDNPSQIIKQLRGTRSNASTPLRRGTRQSNSESNSINVENLLNTAPVDGGAYAPSSQQETITEPGYSQPVETAPAAGSGSLW